MDQFEVMPRVKIMSGRNGGNGRIFIDGHEIKTANDIIVHLKNGAFAEVTVKFAAIVEPEDGTEEYTITYSPVISEEALKRVCEAARKGE